MRVVLDTNTVISAAFWFGAPKNIVELAQDQVITLFTSADLITELHDVLVRPRFQNLLRIIGSSAAEVVAGYLAIASVVKPDVIEAVVAADPDDDAVLACAVAAGAGFIVSGDHHLLALKSYRGIEIVTAATLLERRRSEADSEPRA